MSANEKSAAGSEGREEKEEKAATTEKKAAIKPLSKSELREKANELPLSPGVYLMKDRNGSIIYVGKSKALKNRVSQYFQDTDKHSVKTDTMVSRVANFEVMLTHTEIEALNLENKLIKLYTPKFNIKLKDDRSYPYIKVSMGESFPRLSVVRKRIAGDRAKYFGPYSGTGVAYSIMNTVQKAFGIPSCKKSFPKDIGKTRPCLNYQIGQCCGLCTGEISKESYRAIFNDVISFLSGAFGEVKRSLEQKMNFASDSLLFEAAARYRDRIYSLEKLWEKQRVVASPDVERDIIAIYTDDISSCLAIFYVRNGAVIDNESFIFGADQIIDEGALTGFLYDLYQRREYIPKDILFDFPLGNENTELLSSMLKEKTGYTVRLRFPQKGDSKALCEMVRENAKEYALQNLRKEERDNETLITLAGLLKLEVVPEKIEAFDISNFGNENITAGMIRWENGSFKKSGYRTYKITSTKSQDDYASMKEAVKRRFLHNELEFPDLLLIDGGVGHVGVANEALSELGVVIPTFGMVKDDYHKTRALTDGENEISIAREQAVFRLIYQIQEEVHRYTVSRMTNAKRKTLKTSSLNEIPGIGPTKAKNLLLYFRGLGGVKAAGRDEFLKVKGITERNAEDILGFFKKD